MARKKRKGPVRSFVEWKNASVTEADITAKIKRAERLARITKRRQTPLAEAWAQRNARVAEFQKEEAAREKKGRNHDVK